MRSPRKCLILVVACAATLVLGWTTGPTYAGFPGQNGRFVVGANLGKGFELYSVAADGSTYKRLTFFKDGDFGRGPTWSPDGTTIAFNTIAGDTGKTEIWTIESDGSHLKQLTHDADSNDVVPHYSYDGSRIVFARGLNNFSIWTMKADGTDETQVSTIDGFCPTYGPDGRIYFSSFAKGLAGAIWVMNADGTGKQRLTGPKVQAACPDVSPDGTKVTFNDNGSAPPLPNSIWVMNIDGSGLHQLTHQRYHMDVGPRFSPDGTKIAFVSNRNYADNCCEDLFEMRIDGSHVTQVTSNLTIGGCPSFGNCGAMDWGRRP